NLLANHLNENNENEKNLCVVGDDDQSIYKFRGADITNILNFEEHYPNTKVIKLEQNYRSTANILDAANAVIKNNNGRKPKALWTDKGEGEPIYYKLFESDLNESFGVVDSIMSAVDNGYANYNDFAVLYRTNAQSRSLEEAMIRQNIPYRIVGGINFYQRREIKDILAYLRIIDNSTDSVSINRIINVPKRGIGTASIEKITNYSFENGITFFDSLHEVDNINGISRAKAKLKDFTQLIDDYNEMVYEKGISIVELIDTIIETSEYDTYLYDEDPEKYDDRMENINELKSKAKSYEDENGEDASLSGFLADVSLIADIDTTDETIDNVLLMTLHSAKGLEFPYVFIVGMEDNLFPSYGALNSLDYNESIEAIEEERRLAYVGITRAMTKLALSGAISRFRNGNYEHNEPSMFYREIPDHLINTFSQRLMPFGDDVGKRVIHKAPGQFSSISTKESDNKIFTFTRAGATQKQTRRPKIGALESLAFSSSKTTSLPQQNFDVGDRVKHKKFGDGTITDVTPKGNDKVISVSFDDGKNLKLIASFSKLEKI
nr:UvrD-helicase domain-containing protein [Lachnospiraceae bacterium]